MPQAVKAQAIVCPPLRRMARDLPFNARVGHDCGRPNVGINYIWGETRSH
jgi:hypothetical protein